MKNLASRTAFAALAPLLVFVAHAAPPDIELPAETATLRPSTLPGYAVATQKCGICHSADYVEYQPPNLTQKQWTAEMTKMQKAYGAPISDDEIKQLGAYLASAYGDASSVAVAEAAPAPAAAASATAIDVQALLSANGCLACHAIDKQVLGPAYQAVAAKYKADPQAIAHVATSIVQGGSGKWGTAQMPSFAGLSADDSKALAEYVLKQ